MTNGIPVSVPGGLWPGAKYGLGIASRDSLEATLSQEKASLNLIDNAIC